MPALPESGVFSASGMFPKGHVRHFAPQKNSEHFRRRSTVR